MSNWIYPFRGRNQSMAYSQNFLWNSANVYVMDNHRAALWCWLQHMPSGSQHPLFHIDAHYDCATIRDEDLLRLPDLSAISFREYLDISTDESEEGSIPLIRWDNYLYLFASTRSHQIPQFFVATHGIGDEPPDTVHYEEVRVNELPEMYADFVEGGKDRWIVNIDLDYFFYERRPDEFAKLQSDQYIAEIFRSTRNALLSGKLACLTICLSPECSGGWKSAENLCYQLCDEIASEISAAAGGLVVNWTRNCPACTSRFTSVA